MTEACGPVVVALSFHGSGVFFLSVGHGRGRSRGGGRVWSGGCCRYGWTAVYLSVNGVHFVRILSGSSTEGHRQCQERGGSQEGCPNASAGIPFCSVATEARKARMGRIAANSECKLGRFCSSTRAGHRWPPALALRRPRARKGRVRFHKGARQDSRRCRPIGLFWPELKISELLDAPARPWHGRARGAPASMSPVLRERP